MKGLAKILPGEFFITDPKKLGWIKVLYEREAQWARPCFQFGVFSVPTNEWVTKYGETVFVVVEEVQFGGCDTLIWTGFIFMEDKTPQDVASNYPYIRTHFTENWVLRIDDSVGTASLSLKREDGGVEIIADNAGVTINTPKVIITTSGEDTIITASGKVKTSSGSDTEIVSNGHVTINSGNDTIVNASGKITLNSNNVNLGADGGENTVMGLSFMSFFNTHTHFGNLGIPVSPPITPMSLAQLSLKVKSIK